MRIAIIGTGIAGMTAAWQLHRRHDITVFESAAHVGGHANTVVVNDPRGPLAVDTGFIVHNDRTYPGFCSLMTQLDVATQPSEMSFSVRDESTDFEYCGSSLNGLFAQRRNLLRPRFYRMLRDIVGFNRDAMRFIEDGDDTVTLGAYLSAGGWRDQFVDQYIIPMGAAIWSMKPAEMAEFPALYFLRFFANHGLLQLRDRPQWRTVTGGSARYVDKLTASYRDTIRLRTPVQCVQRQAGGVRIVTAQTDEYFDAVVLACHSDQALRLLDRPSSTEKRVLGAIPYQRNEAVLHTDTRLLPARRRAWASWNYRLSPRRQSRTTLTYNMSLLQRLPTDATYCVTLNDDGTIDPRQVIARFDYDHPVYTGDGVAAQRRYEDINGLGHIYYCGAYWGWGFHEDGVQSALRCCARIERDLQDGKLLIRRVG